MIWNRLRHGEQLETPGNILSTRHRDHELFKNAQLSYNTHKHNSVMQNKKQISRSAKKKEYTNAFIAKTIGQGR